jgi:uncharacterized membrane protein YtjA (UPF0391 family)
MIRWALIFLIFAIVLAIVGFGNFSAAVSGIAIILFWVFLACCVVLFLIGLIEGPPPRR